VSKVVLSMSMSVDGFITGPDDGIEHGLGVDGERLHAWLSDGGVDPGSYRPEDTAGRWQGDHHDSVPVFVLTHDVPDDPPPGSCATSPTRTTAPHRPGRRPGTPT
jgi:hypothetical protein